MYYAASKDKYMKNGMKPGTIDTEFTENRSDSICRASGTEQTEPRFINVAELRNGTEKHCRSADKVYRHTCSFHLFIVEKEYFCYYA